MSRAADRSAMAATEAGGSLVGSVVEMVRAFAEVATASPEQAALVAVGAVLVTAAVAAMGLLAAGAALEWLASVTPGRRGRAPPV